MASGRWLRFVHESFLTADFLAFINPKAAEGRRTPGRRREGRARHSVRAAVVNPDAPVGNRRRAGDCAPYRRFAVSA
jgi:hypothetical protein